MLLIFRRGNQALRWFECQKEHQTWHDYLHHGVPETMTADIMYLKSMVTLTRKRAFRFENEPVGWDCIRIPSWKVSGMTTPRGLLDPKLREHACTNSSSSHQRSTVVSIHANTPALEATPRPTPTRSPAPKPPQGTVAVNNNHQEPAKPQKHSSSTPLSLVSVWRLLQGER